MLREIEARHTNKEIAAGLRIALSRVECHAGAVPDKLGAESRIQAARRAAPCELLPPDELPMA